MRQLKITQQITNRDTQSVEKYLQEVSQIDMISSEDETKFARIIQTANPNSKEYQNAIDSLTKANLRFVVSVAKQYQHQGLALGDLINEGNLGLIKAAGRFDETRGFKFISYAVWRIRQSILQALAEQGRLVKLPQNKIGTYNKVMKASRAFEQVHEREPSDEELAEITALSLNEIHVITAANTRHASLDAGISNDDTDSIALIDTIESTKEELFIGFDTAAEVSESLSRALSAVVLKQRDREILLAYFGLNTMTLEEIGKIYDLTPERIRQIKELTIKKIQKNKVFAQIIRGDEGPGGNTTPTKYRARRPKFVTVDEDETIDGDKINREIENINTTSQNGYHNTINGTATIGSKSQDIMHIIEKDIRTISEERVEAIFARGFNRALHLDVLDINKDKKQCINTFFHYYPATRATALGKKDSYKEILRNAKLRTGLLINDSDFHQYIIEFLDSIRIL